MISITTNDKNIDLAGLRVAVGALGVTFTHKRDAGRPEKTICEVLAFPVGHLAKYANKNAAISISLGVATVFKGDGSTKADNFCFETGRKLSLTRALQACTHLTKADRTAIWDAYHGRK